MRNVVLNVTSTGGWQTLGAAEGFSENTFTVTIQPRTPVDVYFRFAGQLTFMTIKSGGSVILQGKYDPGDIEVMAGLGVVLEIYLSTNIRSLR